MSSAGRGPGGGLSGQEHDSKAMSVCFWWPGAGKPFLRICPPGHPGLQLEDTPRAKGSQGPDRRGWVPLQLPLEGPPRAFPGTGVARPPTWGDRPLLTGFMGLEDAAGFMKLSE